MQKLVDKNRKAQIMTRLQLSLQKYSDFSQSQKMNESQMLRSQTSNDELTRQLSKLLESNKRKKSELKQKLVTGPVGIDINEEMAELRWRMDVLRQNHRSEKGTKQYTSLTGKPQNSQSLFSQKQRKLTFDELYTMQKQKFSALRQRRKNKRLNIQYLQMLGNKDGRRQRNKQLNQQKFNQQMRLLDQTISSGL